MKKYICLEGIEHGNKFYTTNSGKKEPEKLIDGTVAHKVLGYADTNEEARKILYGPNCDEQPEKERRYKDYLNKMPFLKQLGIDKEKIDDWAFILSVTPD